MMRADLQNQAEGDQFLDQLHGASAIEALVAREYKDSEAWDHFGWCDACSQASRFRCDWGYAEGGVPNFRERLVCEQCQLNARQRLVVRVVRELGGLDGEAPRDEPLDIYLYEQVTPLYQVMRQLSGASVVGSEYLGHDVPPGTHRGGIRHEDAQNLSFADGTFDMIVSNDVYEHVPDFEVALREAHRVLRSGGALVATIPFHLGPRTTRRARLTDAGVEHLEPAHYHGNPLSAQGSLVFHDFGWDVLDTCRASGFERARFIGAHSFFHGYLGMAGFVLIAEKAGPG